MALAIMTERRTSADIVFHELYSQIMSLELLPGTKMSEAEIAEKFGVSRQPVRDAFNRLGNLDLLLIQPQKATVVQKFSLEGITAARFVRKAVELEVARVAADKWTGDLAPEFLENLGAQDKALEKADAHAFHELDRLFHNLIARAADTPFASDIIVEKKAVVDRICVLSLKQAHEMEELVQDHKTIFRCLSTGDKTGLEAALRKHLSRIGKTIQSVRDSHSEYFE